MQIVKHKHGRFKGDISVLRTIATMQVGEKWSIAATSLNLGNARVTCSRYGQIVNKSFTVSCSEFTKGRIIITRNS